MIDCHCHLHFSQFDGDRDKIISDAQRENLVIINSTVEPGEAEAGRTLSENRNVYWNLGLSASCTDQDMFEQTLRLLEKHRESIIGVGEVGLDYHWVKEEEEQQIERDFFQRFIEYSKEEKLPLVVHSRDAEEDAVRMLCENGKSAMLHCFSGTAQQALQAVDLGCMISIPANVVYAKSRQKLAEKTPLENIVVETDSPYLSPVPKTRNTPGNVREAVRKIASVKGVSKAKAEEATTLNALAFFGMK